MFCWFVWQESGNSDFHRNRNKNKHLQSLIISQFNFSGELTSQSMMYHRLQTRLNPVPESLNSPDMAPANLGRPPPKDDPIRFYNRDLAISSSTVSTTSSSSATATRAPASTSSPSTASSNPEVLRQQNHSTGMPSAASGNLMSKKNNDEATNGYRFVYSYLKNRLELEFRNAKNEYRQV